MPRAGAEVGQTMAEYSVIMAVITLMIILTIAALSNGITNELTSVIGVF